MKFRKKPVIVEAVQFNQTAGTNHDGVFWSMSTKKFYVTTIHNQRAYLADGDWVIQEPDGEHYYPCKPDVFEQTYEKVR